MTNTSRIAKNTLFLYFRQLLIMLVSLYTVRVVLATLGAEDYGIYNVVAGVVVMFSFVNSAMASGTQRFLNYSLGQGDMVQTRETFSASLAIHAGISLVFIALAETVGLWFVSTRLNVPPMRHHAAIIAYQLAVVTTVFNIFRVPYNALIIAYERMGFFAGISILESTLKLTVVFLLRIQNADRLILYATLISTVSLIMLMCYKWYCNRSFEIARFRKIQRITVAKELLSFSGWTLFGSATNIANAQGSNIILNLFTTVTVNAAVGIANNVSDAAYSFVRNFQIAFNPQIVKSYATGERKAFENLVCRAAKCSFYLFFLIALPFFVNSEFVLQLWLKTVPEYTTAFVQLILIWLLIETISAPLYMAVQTIGKIKWYQLVIGSITILNLPIAGLAFYLGASPLWMLYIRIALSIVALFFRIAICKKLVSLPVMPFSIEALLKPVCITVVSGFLIMQIKAISFDGWSQLFLTTSVSTVLISMLVLFVGLKKEERQAFFNKVKARFS